MRRTPVAALAAILFAPQASLAAESCFLHKTETAEALLTLLLPEGDGPVAGVERGGVQDHKEGYFTSWENAIAGRRTGETLEVSVHIAIEEDRRVEQQTWRIENGAIVAGPAGNLRFEPVSCEEAQEAGFDNVPEHASEDITRGHCADGEEVALTCQITDDDVLSICASADRKALTYFYGPVVAPELEFPKKREGSAGKFMIHTIGYARGYDTRLGFKTGPYTYVVHERMIANEQGKDPDMEAGVTLYEGGKARKELACMSLGEAGVGLNQLLDAVPNKAFFDEEGLVE